MSVRKKNLSVKTLAQARAYIRRVGICGIFSDVEGESLWDAVDLPHRKGGETKWGPKVEAIWQWKNELPAKYPDEVFYGKVPGGLAVLMSIAYLRDAHYPRHHVLLENCSPLAQKIHRLIRLDPLTTAKLRREMDMTQRPERTKFDNALKELQTTLNIARRNSLTDKNDTWVSFREQYLEIVQSFSAK